MLTSRKIVTHIQAFCSQPVFVPHIRGGDLPPGTVTPKESVSQFPCLVAEPTADAPFAPTGPIVTVVAVTCGITATNKAAMQDHLLPGHSEQMSQSPAWADKHQSCTCTQSRSRRTLWSGRSWWSRCSSLEIVYKPMCILPKFKVPDNKYQPSGL